MIRQDGVRFEPALIKKYVVTDGGNLSCCFAGFYPDDNSMGGSLLRLDQWIGNCRFRREYDTYHEAMIEAALIIEQGLAGIHKPQVVQVVYS